MVDITDVWPEWGSSGQSPPNGTDYQSGDNPKASHYNFLWYQIRQQLSTVETRLNAIDSDDDGVVDEADTANRYKNNDIDSDGDGKVDTSERADTATLVKGNDIDSDSDGRVDAAETALRLKGNDVDSDGDGRVDEAETAQRVKGNDIDTDGDGKVDAAEQADYALNLGDSPASDYLKSYEYTPEQDTHSPPTQTQSVGLTTSTATVLDKFGTDIGFDSSYSRSVNSIFALGTAVHFNWNTGFAEDPEYEFIVETAQNTYSKTKNVPSESSGTVTINLNGPENIIDIKNVVNGDGDKRMIIYVEFAFMGEHNHGI